MTERTYQPDGTGLCADCGHDVGRHDGGHEYYGHGRGFCIPCCNEYYTHPIHDVGRVLLCPKEDQ